MNSRIIVISTGGTIEKTYDEGDGSLENKKSIILQQIIKKLRLPYKDIEVIPLMAKDSLVMTDNDRSLIGNLVQDKLIEDCPIVIIHGTDTMEITASSDASGFAVESNGVTPSDLNATVAKAMGVSLDAIVDSPTACRRLRRKLFLY